MSRNRFRSVTPVFCSLVFALMVFGQHSPPLALYADQLTRTLTPTTLAGIERLDAYGIAQVWVPAGCFKMGSTREQVDTAFGVCLATIKDQCLRQEFDAEMTQRTVCLMRGFWIDKFEVTNADFKAFVQAGGYSKREYWSDDGWRWKGKRYGPDDVDCEPDLRKPELPRSCITWYEADAYARWRGGKLPSEAEWEYAARGVDGRLYPWGDAFDGTRLNYCDSSCQNPWRDPLFNDGYVRTAPGGSYPGGKSWVGAYDMSGNVWEWVNDWYDAKYHQSGQDTDPVGPTKGIEKVLRGGSWNMPYIFARTAYRDGVLPDSWSSIIGCRVISYQ